MKQMTIKDVILKAAVEGVWVVDCAGVSDLGTDGLPSLTFVSRKRNVEMINANPAQPEAMKLHEKQTEKDTVGVEDYEFLTSLQYLDR